MRNVWQDGDAFLMALRLRKKGIMLPDVEEVFGQIVVSIVLMATLLLLKEKGFKQCRELFLDPDTQGRMTLFALEKLATADLRKKPRTVINYVVKRVQSRLKNVERDTDRRKRKGEQVSESILGVDLDSLHLCSDYSGQTRRVFPSGRVITQNFDD